MSENYNGSKNYETWTVGLWLNNDQGPYYTCKSLVEEAGNVQDGAEAIRDYVEEMNPLADNASVFSDLLTAALQEVDWREIANDFKPDEWGDNDEAPDPDDEPEDDPDEGDDPEGKYLNLDDHGLSDGRAFIGCKMVECEREHLLISCVWLRESDFDYDWRNDHNVYSRE